MSDKEMVITLKTCLHGSRRKIYENNLKSHKDKGTMELDDGPGKIYRQIKARMMKFLETATERQLRVKEEGQSSKRIGNPSRQKWRK